MNKNKILGISFLATFLMVGLFAGGCGEDLKATNEKLRKEVADLTLDNDKLKSETNRLRTEVSTVHSQIAELNMKISSLQEENNNLQKEMETLKKRRR